MATGQWPQAFGLSQPRRGKRSTSWPGGKGDGAGLLQKQVSAAVLIPDDASVRSSLSRPRNPEKSNLCTRFSTLKVARRSDMERTIAR